MKKYKFNIYNLDCANCAIKLEEQLNKDEKLNNVSINFTTGKISFESSSEIKVEYLNDKIKKIEPDAYVSTLEKESPHTFSLSILIIAICIGLIGYYAKIPSIYKQIFLITSYILLLYKTFINAVKLLIKSKTLNENALITISCIGAYLVGEQLEGMMVIALYTIGKILENKAISNSKNSIKDLINLKENHANIKIDNKIKKIKVEEVKIGDTLIIKKGELVPVDGEVIKGTTSINSSALTGESEQITIKEKDKVLSGYINLENVIEIMATATFENSIVAQILELTQNATDKKTKTETFISKASKIYTPIILALSIIISLILPLISNVTYQESIYRGLTFLVISCPCAIAISVPLAYFIGIGTSSRNGILIKGSNYLDALSNIKEIIFDKTGTLTTGTFNVSNIEIYDNKYSKDEIIDILAKGETFSDHPIAKSILKLKNEKIDNADVTNYKDIEGQGISYTIDKKRIKVGNKDICNCSKEATLHLNIDNKHIASITIDDGIKKDAQDTLQTLKKQNIKIYMFTGDKKEVAIAIGKTLKIDQVEYEMLPTDKYYNYEKIKKENIILAFVGDGINDAPVLKRADLGISMGGIGSEAAIEASDVVIMNDDLSKIPLAITISKYTKKIIKQNLIFAILTKITILILSIFGLTNMWLAVLADTGVTLITIINSIRISKKFKINNTFKH